MKPKQLFCFTYAGGTSAFFDDLEKELSGIEVIKIDYAGHGERHKEKFYEDFDELADDIYGLVSKRYLGGEYALFGYSMGSITLVEVLKRIIDRKIELPSNLFLAAHEPQTKYELLDFSNDELDEWVMNRTLRFGGVPERLLKNKVFWRTYLPIFRADYSLIGKYNFEKLNLRVEIPTTVFYSETDTHFEDMKQWEKYFPCEFFQFAGTHFFIQDHYEAIGQIIREKMGVCNDIR